MPLALLTLAVGAFGIGATECVITGLLSQVSRRPCTRGPRLCPRCRPGCRLRRRSGRGECYPLLAAATRGRPSLTLGSDP